MDGRKGDGAGWVTPGAVISGVFARQGVMGSGVYVWAYRAAGVEEREGIERPRRGGLTAVRAGVGRNPY